MGFDRSEQTLGFGRGGLLFGILWFCAGALSVRTMVLGAFVGPSIHSFSCGKGCRLVIDAKRIVGTICVARWFLWSLYSGVVLYSRSLLLDGLYHVAYLCKKPSKHRSMGYIHGMELDDYYHSPLSCIAGSLLPQCEVSVRAFTISRLVVGDNNERHLEFCLVPCHCPLFRERSRSTQKIHWLLYQFQIDTIARVQYLFCRCQLRLCLSS